MTWGGWPEGQHFQTEDWPEGSRWVTLVSRDGLREDALPVGTVGWCYGGRSDLLFVIVPGRGFCLYPGADRWADVHSES
jgi:hypothetical protein